MPACGHSLCWPPLLTYPTSSPHLSSSLLPLGPSFPFSHRFVPVACLYLAHLSGGYIPGLAPAVVGCCLYAFLGLLAVLRESLSGTEGACSIDDSYSLADLVRHGKKWMLPLIIGLFGGSL